MSVLSNKEGVGWVGVTRKLSGEAGLAQCDVCTILPGRDDKFAGMTRDHSDVITAPRPGSSRNLTDLIKLLNHNIRSPAALHW